MCVIHQSGMGVVDMIVAFYRARGKRLGSWLDSLQAQLTLLSVLRPPADEMEEDAAVIL